MKKVFDSPPFDLGFFLGMFPGGRLICRMRNTESVNKRKAKNKKRHAKVS